MTSEKKIAEVTSPITMNRALEMYGVSSEEELRELFDDLYRHNKRGFLARLFIKIFQFFGIG